MKENWRERNELFIGTKPSIADRFLFPIVKATGVLGEIPFEINQETIDTLKLEISVLSPKEDQEMQFLIRELNRQITNHYGQYISKERVKEGEGIEKRFIFTDFEGMDNMNLLYTNVSLEGDKKTLATYSFRGDLIISVDKESMFEEDDIPGFLKIEEFVKVIKHEIVHFYQNPTLPMYLMQSGADFYAGRLEYLGASIYKKFLEENGDLVHELHFGKRDDKVTKSLVKKFEQEVFRNVGAA